MILCDTHVLVWHIEGQTRLGEAARNRIEAMRRSDGILISAISAWEIVRLVKAGRLDLSKDVDAWLGFVRALPGYIDTPVSVDMAMRAAALDWNHCDPADRFLVATSLELSVPLLTADREILDYAAAGHVEAIDARQ